MKLDELPCQSLNGSYLRFGQHFIAGIYVKPGEATKSQKKSRSSSMFPFGWLMIRGVHPNADTPENSGIASDTGALVWLIICFQEIIGYSSDPFQV